MYAKIPRRFLSSYRTVYRSFATSVGSGTLKLWQAIIIAAIFEFAGAVGLGSETTKTVAGDITNLTYFTKQPEL
jgi:sodium-dependent phosphate transporter